MESLKLKKAIFKPGELILFKKKGDIFINIDNIELIEYTKPNFINFLLDSGYPGYLRIYLNKKVNNSKSYLVKIKYYDVLKLPEVYRKKMLPK